MFSKVIGNEITVELKNDLCIKGILQGVDQYLNLTLTNTTTLDADKYPHMVYFRIFYYNFYIIFCLMYLFINAEYL